MSASTVLWVYAAFLILGGLIGFAVAKSKVSLITSVVFAVLLAMCAADIAFKPSVAYFLLGALVLVFSIRWSKTKKFMPSGMLAAVTVVTLVAYAVLANSK
jgi:uncharacterized membrane protein (UPF0136 family)